MPLWGFEAHREVNGYGADYAMSFLLKEYETKITSPVCLLYSIWPVAMFLCFTSISRRIEEIILS